MSQTTPSTRPDTNPAAAASPLSRTAPTQDELARIREAARQRAAQLPPMSEELAKLTRNLLRSHQQT